jgi:hypothetical protein
VGVTRKKKNILQFSFKIHTSLVPKNKYKRLKTQQGLPAPRIDPLQIRVGGVTAKQIDTEGNVS